MAPYGKQCACQCVLSSLIVHVCVSLISPEHSDGIISRGKDGNRGRKADEYGIKRQNLPLTPQPHTVEAGED